MNELVTYFDHNPDQYHDACMNSGIVEEGVVFNHVEPAEGFQTFIGVTSLLAAVAEVYGLTPNQVKDRLTREKKMVDNLRERLEAAEARAEAYERVVMGLRDVIAEHIDTLTQAS